MIAADPGEVVDVVVHAGKMTGMTSMRDGSGDSNEDEKMKGKGKKGKDVVVEQGGARDDYDDDVGGVGGREVGGGVVHDENETAKNVHGPTNLRCCA